ncbi:MAG: hypothetical protein RO257_14780 [Candidatus Kapabacteria bacterium]|nr:hypothetical protein [Candidatus Kapabacteria bacterium]
MAKRFRENDYSFLHDLTKPAAIDNFCNKTGYLGIMIREKNGNLIPIPFSVLLRFKLRYVFLNTTKKFDMIVLETYLHLLQESNMYGFKNPDKSYDLKKNIVEMCSEIGIECVGLDIIFDQSYFDVGITQNQIKSKYESDLEWNKKHNKEF